MKQNDSRHRGGAGHRLDPALALVGLQTLELFLPSTCRLCDRSVEAGEDFCASCTRRLYRSEISIRSGCRRCGRPGAGCPPDQQPDEHADCLACRKEKLAFDRCISLWSYRDLVCEAIVASKFGSRIALADALGRRLGGRVAETLSGDQDLPDLITSVPSHLLRRISRGGGGCQVIARSMANHVSICMEDSAFARKYRDLLATNRKIKKQAWLGDTERADNVAGAFRIRQNPFQLGGSRQGSRRKSLGGRHVLVVDDVMTTGATANEIARVLKAAGARRVTVAVVARAHTE